MNVEVKVSDQIALLLEELDIRHAFGIIGAGNVHLFESIARHGYTEIVCVHHEQTATMAMQTYYRTTGRLCAALLTTGGGAANGVTGVISAWADSIPGLVIAGNEHSRHTSNTNPLRMWGVQGFDSVAMMDKVVKYSVRVTDPHVSLFEIEKAANASIAGRPGPVWVEVPMDVQSARLPANEFNRYCVGENATLNLSTEQIQSVISGLENAKRPLLWLGHGIRLSGAISELQVLLGQLNVPALVSWAGIDMVDSNDPRIIGRAGVYGQRAANFSLQNCDYLLAIGTRLAIPQIGYDITELARQARIDMVDIDAAEGLKLQSRIENFIQADALHFINKLITHTPNGVGCKEEWLSRCKIYQEKYPWLGPEHNDTHGFINSYRFHERLNKFLKPNQIIVTDMGTALLCAHTVLKLSSGQRLMTSTGLGEMGYGLPGAIGASFANNRGEVMCLNCDGGMMMNLQELQTVVHHQLPIKIFIFNNDGYLMIKHTQKALFGDAGYIGTDKISGISCPDYSKIASAFGIPSYQIRDWENCDEVLNEVQAANGPVICEVFMDPEQLFVPKLSVAATPTGELVSPPLEDLSPLLPLNDISQAMTVPLHDKSMAIRDGGGQYNDK